MNKIKKMVCGFIIIVLVFILSGCQSTEGTTEQVIYDTVDVVSTEYIPAKEKLVFENGEAKTVVDKPAEYLTILSHNGYIIEDKRELVYKIVSERPNENYVKLRLKYKTVDGKVESVKVLLLDGDK